PTAAVPFAMTPVATVGAAPVVALTDSEAVIPAPAAEDSTPVPALPDTLTAAPPAGDTPPAPAMIAKRLLHRRVGRYELSLTRHDLAMAESEQDAALAAADEPEPAPPPLQRVTWRRPFMTAPVCANSWPAPWATPSHWPGSSRTACASARRSTCWPWAFLPG
ncbi:MAG: hypothetical protein WAV53_13700, partial [Anaerolineae bacterium]